MKRRLGIFLYVLLTLLFLKLISMGLGWINLPNDAAVTAGVCLIGAIVVLSPSLYVKIWKKMIHPINNNEEKQNEV